MAKRRVERNSDIFRLTEERIVNVVTDGQLINRQQKPCRTSEKVARLSIIDKYRLLVCKEGHKKTKEKDGL